VTLRHPVVRPAHHHHRSRPRGNTAGVGAVALTAERTRSGGKEREILSSWWLSLLNVPPLVVPLEHNYNDVFQILEPPVFEGSPPQFSADDPPD
ncbi:hypothetical protein NHX12_014857, partial [Muraenolepis orangiensis]